MPCPILFRVSSLKQLSVIFLLVCLSREVHALQFGKASAEFGPVSLSNPGECANVVAIVDTTERMLDAWQKGCL